MSAWMNRKVAHTLRGLLEKAEHHREAIREFGIAGYWPMVEQHRAKLRAVNEQIRQCCLEDDSTLPEAILDAGEAALRPSLRPAPHRFP